MNEENREIRIDVSPAAAGLDEAQKAVFADHQAALWRLADVEFGDDSSGADKWQWIIDQMQHEGDSLRTDGRTDEGDAWHHAAEILADALNDAFGQGEPE